jgi:hypothetical protein
MLATDPLTKTPIFQFPIVTKQLAANFFLLGFAITLVALRFVARRVRKNEVWYVYFELMYIIWSLTDGRWDDIAAVASLIFTYGKSNLISSRTKRTPTCIAQYAVFEQRTASVTCR